MDVVRICLDVGRVNLVNCHGRHLFEGSGIWTGLLKENEDDGIVTPSSDDTSPMVSEQGHSTLRIQNSVISICMRDLELETEM